MEELGVSVRLKKVALPAPRLVGGKATVELAGSALEVLSVGGVPVRTCVWAML